MVSQQQHSQAKQIPAALLQKISDLLLSLPGMHSQSTRQALLWSAELDRDLLNRIDMAGSPAHFVEQLLHVLLEYGDLEDGRDALEAVLLAARNSLGRDAQERCNMLIQGLKSL